MGHDVGAALPLDPGPGFLRRTILLEPGECRPYLADEWRDCLVVVEAGDVDLETTGGLRHTCRRGDILWLAGLPIQRLVNRGPAPVLITSVRRR